MAMGGPCKGELFSHLIMQPMTYNVQPFIESSRYTFGSIVLESPSPFTVPHIIINTPPPCDPWVAYRNTTSNPQDCGWGQYLIVPTQYVDFINISEKQMRYGYGEARAEIECQHSADTESSADDSDTDLFESDAASCASSRPSSPGPPTPRCIDDHLFKFTMQVADSSDESEDEDEERSLYRLDHEGQGLPSFWTSSQYPVTTGIESRDAPYGLKLLTDFIFEEDAEDSEDGPPPFDAWYTGLSARAQ